MLLFTHPACLAHDPGAGHPECPARLEAVLHALRAAYPALPWREAPAASREALRRVHTPALISEVLDLATDGPRRLDRYWLRSEAHAAQPRPHWRLGQPKHPVSGNNGGL